MLARRMFCCSVASTSRLLTPIIRSCHSTPAPKSVLAKWGPRGVVLGVSGGVGFGVATLVHVDDSGGEAWVWPSRERVRSAGVSLGVCGVAVGLSAVTAAVLWRRSGVPLIPATSLLIVPNALAIYRRDIEAWLQDTLGLEELGSESQRRLFVWGQMVLLNGLGLGLLWARLPQPGEALGCRFLAASTKAAVAKGAVLAACLVPGLTYAALELLPPRLFQSDEADVILNVFCGVALFAVLVRNTARINKMDVRGTDKPLKMMLFGRDRELNPHYEKFITAAANSGGLLAASILLVAGVQTFMIRESQGLESELPVPAVAPPSIDSLSLDRVLDFDTIGLDQFNSFIFSAKLSFDECVFSTELLWTPALLLFVSVVELFIAMI